MTERGCGFRTAGVYACCGLSPNGTPLSDLTFCPPLPIPDWVNVPALGSVLVPEMDEYGETTYHILDRKGLNHYPNVADFYEEVRRMGVSTRLSPLLDFSKLSRNACVYHVHDRAYIENWYDYGFRHERCRAKNPNHSLEDMAVGPQEQFCIGLWWQDLEEGEEDPDNPGFVIRKMPSFEYRGQARPKGVVPVYEQRIFMRTPISRFDVLPGSEEETERWLVALAKSERPYQIVEE